LAPGLVVRVWRYTHATCASACDLVAAAAGTATPVSWKGQS
jgi:hypothetical protein